MPMDGEPFEPLRGRAEVALQPAVTTLVTVIFAHFVVGSIAQATNIAAGLLFDELFIFFVPALLLARAARYPPAVFLGLRRPRARAVALGFLIGVANFPVAGGLQALVRAFVPDELARRFDSSQMFQNQTPLEMALLVLAVVVAAPLCEETFFRGYFQRIFADRRGPVFAIGLTALLFSATHGDPIGFIARLELGVLFGLLAFQAGNLWPSIAAHAANNLTSTLLFVAGGGLEESSETTGHMPALGALLVITAGLGITLPLVRRFLYGQAVKPKPVQPEELPGDHAPELRRVSGLLVIALMAVVLFWAAYLVIDHRGAALSWVDQSYPTPKLLERIDDPSLRQDASAALTRLRQCARKGEIPVAEYRQKKEHLYERPPGGQAAPRLKPDEVRKTLGIAAPRLPAP